MTAGGGEDTDPPHTHTPSPDPWLSLLVCDDVAILVRWPCAPLRPTVLRLCVALLHHDRLPGAECIPTVSLLRLCPGGWRGLCPAPWPIPWGAAGWDFGGRHCGGRRHWLLSVLHVPLRHLEGGKGSSWDLRGEPWGAATSPHPPIPPATWHLLQHHPAANPPVLLWALQGQQHLRRRETEILRHPPQEATPPSRNMACWHPLLPVPACPVPAPRSPELCSSWRRAERLLSCWGLSSGRPRP